MSRPRITPECTPLVPYRTLTTPGYWMHEISGQLRRPITKYLNGLDLDAGEIALMRAYCRQWINATAWENNPHGTTGLHELRDTVDTITDKATLSDWLEHAIAAGIDPL